MFGKKVSDFFAGRQSEKTTKVSPYRARKLTMEPLESREMLSVSPIAPPELENNGTVIMQSISSAPDIIGAAAVTELSGVNITINATNIAEYDFSQVTSITNSTIIADGVTLNFANCTEMIDANLTAKNGGVIKFTKLERFSTSNVSGAFTWEATGTGSRLEFAALTRLFYGYYDNTVYWHNLTASSGGVIDLSKVTSIQHNIQRNFNRNGGTHRVQR